MITFALLMLIIAVMIASAIVFLLTGSIAFIISFGDIIVCVMIIWLIVRHCVKKKNK